MYTKKMLHICNSVYRHNNNNEFRVMNKLKMKIYLRPKEGIPTTISCPLNTYALACDKRWYNNDIKRQLL